jgi:virulence-associated protein VapD
MTNLNQLQSELAALTERVNCAMSLTDGSIYLTREQLKQLINKVQEQTKEWIENEVDDMRFDEDDFIDLDLNGREIDLNFNEDQLRREIKGNIGGPEDINDDELDTLLNEIKEA